MQRVIYVYKPRGLTPRQTIALFKLKHPQYEREKIGYAGRLDPMAEGLLLLLIGLENKKRKTYESLSKTYQFDILLGIATDTFDLLGIVTHTWDTPFPDDLMNRAEGMIKNLVGTNQQAYPPFSSKPVSGKPLFWWAREEKLHTITIPQKSIVIKASEIVRTASLPVRELQRSIYTDIPRVTGDFRQERILSSWESFFFRTKQLAFPVITSRVTCSSGTYIRSLAHQIGQNLGTNALALRIIRTGIDCVTLESPQTVRILS